MIAVALWVVVSSCGDIEHDEPAAVPQSNSYAAPRFRLPTLGGGETALADSAGAVRVVNFWATWCVPCRVEMPSLERLERRFSDSRDVVVLAISVDADVGVVADYLQEEGYTFRVLLDYDRRVAGTYGVDVFPTTFILDKDGRVADRVVGVSDWAGDDKVAFLRALVGR